MAQVEDGPRRLHRLKGARGYHIHLLKGLLKAEGGQLGLGFQGRPHPHLAFGNAPVNFF